MNGLIFNTREQKTLGQSLVLHYNLPLLRLQHVHIYMQSIVMQAELTPSLLQPVKFSG